MANFDTAFYRTVITNEGPYDNDPKDPGGETCWGITRKYQALWTGWALVDKIRGSAGFPGTIESDKGLMLEVQNFYRQNWWARIQGDYIESQEVVEELFDAAVNCGLVTVIKWLQRALNAFNRGATDYPDVPTDGNFGEKTLSALSGFLKLRPGKIMVRALDAQQGMHYIEICEKNPALEKFEAGWFLRRIGG